MSEENTTCTDVKKRTVDEVIKDYQHAFEYQKKEIEVLKKNMAIIESTVATLEKHIEAKDKYIAILERHLTNRTSTLVVY